MVLGSLAAMLGGPLCAQTVQLNELQSANDRTLLDEDGESSDWIELWNPADAAFDLSGFGLSDSPGSPFKWSFDAGSVMAPGEFLVVFASGKNRQPSLAPPLSPDQLPGLEVWLRADAVNPADPDQVRTTIGGTFVRRWLDTSGRGNDAIQTADHLEPLWLPASATGPAALRFDGANDLLRLPRPAATNDFCVFAVFRTSQSQETDPESASSVGGTSGQRWLFGANHGGDFDAGMGLSAGTNGFSVYEHGSGYMPALAVYQRPVGNGLQIVAVNYTSRQPVLDHQGLLVHTGLSSPRREVWAPVEIGSGAYGAFGGDLLEVLVFHRALSAGERRGVARYLADRYDIKLPLPRHTNFALNAAGEEVILTRPDGTVVDRISFGAVPRDVSYGRAPETGGRWVYFAAPTPGAANTTPGSTEWLFPPTFSHEGGFYTNGFDLVLAVASGGAEVRYTLNGAEPTTNSPVFSGSIPIRSRVGSANFLSAIPTVPGGQPPAGEVFKGWVVRARTFKEDAMPSATVTRSFWVHPLGRARYSVPVVSLATDRRNFFDPDLGIYVPGNAPNGNYSQRGPEWERPVHVELYEPDGSLALAQDGDAKIHGNTSQNFPIKGLDLDGTGGAGRQPFRHRFFPDRARTEFEHVLLRPSGHDHGMAFMRDELMQRLGSETGAESQAARLCVVFLNGEYWGLHYLKEKEDAEFVGFYGDVPTENLDYLEGYAVAKAGDTVHYDAMIRFLAANDPALPPVYEQVQTLIEVPNYIDYKVCEIFNYRWDIGNHRLWRPRTPEGRWRWLQFDNDVGWGGFWADQPGWTYDMLTADLTPDGRLHDHNNEVTTFLLRRLVLNGNFRRDFINRFADLLNTTLAATNTLAQVVQLAAVLAPEMAEHCQRWRVPGSLAHWQQSVESLREFARQRPAFCRQHVLNNFGLPGVADVSLAVSPPGGGRLRLNSLSLAPATTAPWRGAYFRGNPVHLVAEPATGYRFAGWDGLSGVETNDVRLQLQGNWSLTARFEPLTVTPATLALHGGPPQPLELRVSGAPGTRWAVETSPDLVTWLPLQELTLGAAGGGLATINATSARAFFRARLPAGQPAN